jgi:hypothetical protein
MHIWIRRVHLACGLGLMAFVVMYFVTGYVLTRGSLFGEPRKSTVERKVEVVPMPARPEETAFAEELQKQFGLRGQRAPARRNPDGTWRFVFFRPGYVAEARLDANLTSATITETRYGWQRVLVGFHRQHGYGGGWLYDVWAFIYDLASAAMIVFALTGVLLWHRLARPRWPGWVILGCGLAYVVATLSCLLVRR